MALESQKRARQWDPNIVARTCGYLLTGLVLPALLLAALLTTLVLLAALLLLVLIVLAAFNRWRTRSFRCVSFDMH